MAPDAGIEIALPCWRMNTVLPPVEALRSVWSYLSLGGISDAPFRSTGSTSNKR